MLKSCVSKRLSTCELFIDHVIITESDFETIVTRKCKAAIGYGVPFATRDTTLHGDFMTLKKESFFETELKYNYVKIITSFRQWQFRLEVERAWKKDWGEELNQPPSQASSSPTVETRNKCNAKSDKNVYKQESHLIADAIFSRSTLQDLLQVWKEKN